MLAVWILDQFRQAKEVYESFELMEFMRWWEERNTWQGWGIERQGRVKRWSPECPGFRRLPLEEPARQVIRLLIGSGMADQPDSSPISSPRPGHSGFPRRRSIPETCAGWHEPGKLGALSSYVILSLHGDFKNQGGKKVPRPWTNWISRTDPFGLADWGYLRGIFPGKQISTDAAPPYGLRKAC